MMGCQVSPTCGSRSLWQRTTTASAATWQRACATTAVKRCRGSVQKELFAASATTTACVERKHNRPLLLLGRRHKMTEDNLRKASLHEATVLQEGGIKSVQTLPSSKATVRIRCVIIGILPHVKKHKTKSGWHIEVDSHPSRKPKKSGGKGSVASWKAKQLGCVFQDTEPPKPMSLPRKVTKSLGPKRSVHFSEGCTTPQKIGKRRTVAKCGSAV